MLPDFRPLVLCSGKLLIRVLPEYDPLISFKAPGHYSAQVLR